MSSNLSLNSILDQINPHEDYFNFHRQRYYQILNWLNSFDRQSKILDIGAFQLDILAGAHALGFKNLYGTELPVFIKKYQTKIKKLGARIKPCDLAHQKIPFPKNSVDLIIFTEILEHLNFYSQPVFNEFARLLKPGGQVLITTPNQTRLNNKLKILLGKSIYHDIAETYHVGTHYREFTAKEIEYLANTAGLQIKQLKYVDFNFPNRGRTETLINKIMGTLVPPLKSNLWVILTKEK